MADVADVVGICADLIRFDTTNRGGGDASPERPAAEYVAAFLDGLGIPSKIFEAAPGRASVIARVAGTDPSLPALLVQGHLDVVPADAADWSVPPFSGEVRDGYLWGRGATDMKDFVAMVLAALAGGARPRRDVVLAFVADEEDRGDYGAHWLVAAHPELFEGCAAAISESGGYTYHVPAADGRIVHLYPVGTAERGTAHLRLTARGRAGHGSRPNDENAVTRLVDALHRIAAHQWPVSLTPTVQAFLERTGAALGIPVDLSDVDATVAALGPAGGLVVPTVRNSTTPTMLDAGYKVNVIPTTATAQVDVGCCRAPRTRCSRSWTSCSAKASRGSSSRTSRRCRPRWTRRGSRRWPRLCRPKTPRRWWCRTAWAVAPTRRRSPSSGS